MTTWSAQPAPGRTGSAAPRIAIIGGGVIGLGLAWQLSVAGARVDLFEAGRLARAASHAAAGMLATAAESPELDDELLAFCQASQAQWPAFGRAIEAASGIRLDLRHDGILSVALDERDAAALRAQAERLSRHGIAVERLDAAALQTYQPGLSAAACAGVLFPGDGKVDNRRLGDALIELALKGGARLHADCPVTRLMPRGGRIGGVETPTGRVDADIVVIAAGAWSGRLLEPLGIDLPLRPLKGQMLALAPPSRPGAGALHRVTWGPGIYLVPRTDGAVMLGASVEEAGFDTGLEPGVLRGLREAAETLVPALASRAVAESWAGLRPTTPDLKPLLGPAGLPGVILATGHHRNGILLLPATLKALVPLIMDGAVTAPLRAFAADRFAAA